MLLIIQGLYLISILAIVLYLFIDFRKHHSLGRHMWHAWILLVAHSILFPMVIYGIFRRFPEVLRTFFPDGPIGPHNVAWLFAGLLWAFVLWLFFIGSIYGTKYARHIYTSITNRPRE